MQCNEQAHAVLIDGGEDFKPNAGACVCREMSERMYCTATARGLEVVSCTVQPSLSRIMSMEIHPRLIAASDMAGVAGDGWPFGGTFTRANSTRLSTYSACVCAVFSYAGAGEDTNCATAS